MLCMFPKYNKYIRQYVIVFVCIIFCHLNLCTASISASLQKGTGGLIYDACCENGPCRDPVNNPGQWISAIQSFSPMNASPTRLYVYGGAIRQNTPLGNCNFSVNYAFADSVEKYRQAFPSALILATIDATSDDVAALTACADTVGKGLADSLSSQICADSHVDGVVFDLEPADFGVGMGQYGLYKEMALNFSSGACVSVDHPNGRYFGVFSNPNNFYTRNQWAGVEGALVGNGPNNVGFLIVGAYDVTDGTQGPTPYSLYKSSISGKLSAYTDPQSKQYHVPYTVAVPGGASFGEYQYYAQYVSPTQTNIVHDYSNEVTQTGYVNLALQIIATSCSSPYYLGVDYWGWNQFVWPDHSTNNILLPNTPNGTVAISNCTS